MLDEIYQKVNEYKRKTWQFWIVYMIITVLMALFFVYRIINKQNNIIPLIALITFFIVGMIVCIVVNIKNTKSINRIVQEDLMPYILRQVNHEFQLTDEMFKKEDVIKSLFISRYGSFKSSHVIKGMNDNIPFKFGFITNYISAGQTYYEVFSGTYLVFTLNQSIDGFIQIRDKGRAEKNKKLDIDRHAYKGEIANRFSDFKFFTSQDLLAETYITPDLVKLYAEIKKEFKKGFYLSIVNNKLVVGIHDRKNLVAFSFIKKMNNEWVEERIVKLRKMNHIIRKITHYIHENLNQ